MDTELTTRLRGLMERASPGPVLANGREVCGGTDDEPRHIAICGWAGEAELYAATRNALPTLLDALEAQGRDLAAMTARAEKLATSLVECGLLARKSTEELIAAEARALAFEQELRNIADAKRFSRKHFENGDEDFAPWAQNRARHAIDAAGRK